MAQAVRRAAEEAFGGKMLWGMMAMSLAFGVGIFFIAPLLLTRLVDPFLPTALHSVLVEGTIRIALFFGYVWLIGRLPDVRRVFAYHGAEHKAINALKRASRWLRPAWAATASPTRAAAPASCCTWSCCRSSSSGCWGGRRSGAAGVARVLLVPVVASVAYEVIRFSARHQHNPAVRALLVPGLALQS